MSKDLELTLREVNDFANLFHELGQTKGHGLAFQIGKNKFELKNVLELVEKQLNSIREPYQKDAKKVVYDKETNEALRPYKENDKITENEVVGVKLSEKHAKELNEAIKQLEEETHKVKLIELDKEKFEKACDDAVFDGVDLSVYFDFIGKF